MVRLVLLRHGESVWNKENRFTGWTDVDLTEKGIEEAKHAGKVLRREGYAFDIAYTSVLKRAIKTLHYILGEMDMLQLPVVTTWRLNERHYGALQGLNKAETAKRYGQATVKAWRRSYDTRPPELTVDDERYLGHELRYASVNKEDLPLTESLKDTLCRLRPYWNGTILPEIRQQRRVIIVAHANSLRALVKHLDTISDTDVVDLEMPTGIPLVYEMSEEGKVLKKYYLDDSVATHATGTKSGSSTNP